MEGKGLNDSVYYIEDFFRSYIIMTTNTVITVGVVPLIFLPSFPHSTPSFIPIPSLLNSKKKIVD